MSDPHYRKASLSASGPPTLVEAKYVGQIYLDSDAGTAYVAYGVGAGEWKPVPVSGIDSETETILSMDNAIGYLEMGVAEGLVYYLKASVDVSTTPDADVELGDASFGGSPNLLYQIGKDSESNPLWDPDSDGDWIDRNAFGIIGLTAGKLYYRLTNNGPNTIDMTLEVRVIG